MTYCWILPTFYKNLNTDYSQTLPKKKRREHFSAHYLRPILPWNQNQTSQEKYGTLSFMNIDEKKTQYYTSNMNPAIKKNDYTLLEENIG